VTVPDISKSSFGDSGTPRGAYSFRARQLRYLEREMVQEVGAYERICPRTSLVSDREVLLTRSPLTTPMFCIKYKVRRTDTNATIDLASTLPPGRVASARDS